MPAKEWSSNKKWNPFNSDKLLAHVERWSKIRRGEQIPQPILVTVDPINRCNFKCVYCNADFVLSHNKSMISRSSLLNIADFLSEWKTCKSVEPGVAAICIAGGGEPLMNEHVGEFINRCIVNGIEVGVVTNGFFMDRFIEPLSKCTWVGVSVDAGNSKTFEELKEVKCFDRVIENISLLIKYARDNNTRLNMPNQGYGVSYKFLMHPINVYDIEQAANLAKSLGCRNFHLRPVGVPWDKIGQSIGFSIEMIDAFNEQIEKCRELEDDSFGAFGVTHKFGSKLEKENCFEKCHAVFMTAVFVPSEKGENYFDVGLCCDRRGDEQVTLAKNINDPWILNSLWGGEKHWKIYDNIDVMKCPRCTYQPHNIIFENVIKTDNMTYKFI